MHYTLISFDLDGTLVDTASEIAEAANRTLLDIGQARIPADRITPLIGHGAHALMRKLLEQLQADGGHAADRWPVAAVLQAFDDHYAQTVGSSARPYAGARETLHRLRSAGIRVACTTNKELRHALCVLRANRLDGYFDMVLGGDSLPEKKPHASVLRTLAARLDCEPGRMAHVGDSAIDVAAARNAGVPAWAVPYGYNGGQPIGDSRPDRIFDRLSDVADHVLSPQAPAGNHCFNAGDNENPEGPAPQGAAQGAGLAHEGIGGIHRAATPTRGGETAASPTPRAPEGRR